MGLSQCILSYFEIVCNWLICNGATLRNTNMFLCMYKEGEQRKKREESDSSFLVQESQDLCLYISPQYCRALKMQHDCKPITNKSIFRKKLPSFKTTDKRRYSYIAMQRKSLIRFMGLQTVYAIESRVSHLL